MSQPVQTRDHLERLEIKKNLTLKTLDPDARVVGVSFDYFREAVSREFVQDVVKVTKIGQNRGPSMDLCGLSTLDDSKTFQTEPVKPFTNSMWHSFQQWMCLAPWERRMFVMLVLLLPATSAAPRILGFKRTRDMLERSSVNHSPEKLPNTSQTLQSPDRIARLVGIAAGHGLYRATCLPQALVTWWLLRRRGIRAKLRIGVRKDGQTLCAHAWVEFENRPLNDDQGVIKSYATLTTATAATVHE